MESTSSVNFEDLPQQLVPPCEGPIQVASECVASSGSGKLQIVEEEKQHVAYEDVSSDEKDSLQKTDTMRKTTEDTDSEDFFEALKKRSTLKHFLDSESEDERDRNNNVKVEKKKKTKAEKTVSSSDSDDKPTSVKRSEVSGKRKKSKVIQISSSDEEENARDYSQIRKKKKTVKKFLDSDTEDDEVTEKKKKNHTIAAFKSAKPKYKTDSSEEEKIVKPTSRQMMQGESSQGSKISKKLFPLLGGDYGIEYLEALKSAELSPSKSEDFFEAGDCLVTRFGHVSSFRGRLGYCEFGNTFKIYIRKHNPKFSPSILGFHYSDIEEISGYLRKALAKVKKQKDEGRLPVGNKSGRKYLPSQIEFWMEPDVYQSASGSIRIRIVWDKKMYNFHFNMPVESANHPNYLGPKMKLVVKEVAQLLDCFDGIVTKCPPAEKMMTLD